MKRRLCLLTSIALLSISAIPANAVDSLTQNAKPALDVSTAGSRAAWAAVMKRQEPLSDVATEVQKFVDTHPGSGFAGVSTDVYRDAVDIYWRGAVPPAITTIGSAAQARQTHVEIHSAPYSQNELDTAKAALRKLLEDRHARFISVGRKIDGTGLTLGRPTELTTNSPANNTLIDEVIGAAGIPVDVADEVPLQSTSRYADSAPFWGGDLIQALPDSGPYCSGGFPASGPNNQWFMLTAWHCANELSGRWYTGVGDLIGQNNGFDVTHDAMRVEMPPPPSGSPFPPRAIYTGGSFVDPASETAAEVRGAGRPHVGEFVCTSGTFSGELCGIRVTNVGRDTLTCDENGQNCVIFHDMALAEQQDHLNAGGNGDSGGPVFSYLAGGTVLARGILSGNDPRSKPAACTGYPSGNGRLCSWQVSFPDILNVTAALGVGV